MTTSRVNNSDYYLNAISSCNDDINTNKVKKDDAAESCDKTAEVRDTQYAYRNSIYSQRDDAEYTKKQIEKQISELNWQMKIAVANASKNGKTGAQIDAIKQEYGDKIGLLESSLAINTKDCTTIEELAQKANEAYYESRGQNNSAVGWFLDVCRKLFNLELDKGRLEQESIVYNSQGQFRTWG